MISINTIPLSLHVTYVSLFSQIPFFSPENCFHATHLIDFEFVKSVQIGSALAAAAVRMK